MTRAPEIRASCPGRLSGRLSGGRRRREPDGGEDEDEPRPRARASGLRASRDLGASTAHGSWFGRGAARCQRVGTKRSRPTAPAATSCGVKRIGVVWLPIQSSA